jgi:hypothetical protein
LGDIGEVNVLSVDLTENGEEVNVSADDGLEDFWGDDVLLEEDVQEEDIAFGDGVDVDELTDDLVEGDLSADDQFVDLWGDDVLVEEDLDEEGIELGDFGEVNVLSVDFTEDGEEVSVSAEDGHVHFGGDHVLLEEDVQEEDIAFGDGVDELVVELTDDLVEGDLSADDQLVDLWGDDVLVEENLDEEGIKFGDFGEVEILAVDFTKDGEEGDLATDDGLEDFWGDHVLLEEDVQKEDIIDVLSENGVDGLDWETLLLNHGVDLGFFNGDQLVGEQVLGDLLQKEFVVGGSEWQVLSSEAGGGLSITVVVNVWEDIHVPGVDIILDKSLVESEDILRKDIILSVEVVDWGVLGVEELDKGLDVLVEEDRVQEVLLEGRDLPESLEVDGGNITLEGWVLDVLTEEGKAQVLTEELGLVQLIDGEDLVDILDVAESLKTFQVIDPVLNWVDIIDNIPFQGELVDQILLHQQIIDDWPGVQQGFPLEKTDRVQIQVAGGNGCDEGDEDKGFHDDSL